jgi:hypothetical protein
VTRTNVTGHHNLGALQQIPPDHDRMEDTRSRDAKQEPPGRGIGAIGHKMRWVSLARNQAVTAANSPEHQG